MKQSGPPALRFLVDALDKLDQDGLLRAQAAPRCGTDLSFCSNDYLALATERVPGEDADTGAGASRLVSGDRQEHHALEAAAADLASRDSALAFSSGYAANVGTLSALAGPTDLIVSDALNHASLIDGARLSRARIVVVPHLNSGAVRRALQEPRASGARAWVVTESYFSMDADSPNLAELRSICDAAEAALVVDEAHAFGVLGPGGRGLCVADNVAPDVVTGTFGKAFGAGGAFVAGCANLTSWLWNAARPFVFSTGLSPSVAAAATAALKVATSSPELRTRALRNAAQFRAGLQRLGIDPLGYGHIVPCVVGTPARAVRISRELSARGVHVQAIRPPSVPPGTARLRFTLTARHTSEDVARALAAVEEVWACDRG